MCVRVRVCAAARTYVCVLATDAATAATTVTTAATTTTIGGGGRSSRDARVFHAKLLR
jgi:hypothetical protein